MSSRARLECCWSASIDASRQSGIEQYCLTRKLLWLSERDIPPRYPVEVKESKLRY